MKKLLAKEMSRKEFLQLIGVGVLTLFGVSNLIATLAKHADKAVAGKSPEALEAKSNFGSRKFGA